MPAREVGVGQEGGGEGPLPSSVPCSLSTEGTCTGTDRQEWNTGTEEKVAAANPVAAEVAGVAGAEPCKPLRWREECSVASE